jgi:hypothetical protein
MAGDVRTMGGEKTRPLDLGLGQNLSRNFSTLELLYLQNRSM